MYRLHSYMQGLRIQDLRQEALSLHRDIANMKIAMNRQSNENVLTSGVSIFPFGPESEQYLGDHDILGEDNAENQFPTAMKRKSRCRCNSSVEQVYAESVVRHTVLEFHRSQYVFGRASESEKENRIVV